MLIILSVLQLTVIPLIAIGSVVPDLVIILVIVFTLQYGQFYGTIFGAISGLFFDLISGGILGSAMFAKTLSAFAAGYFYNENKIEYNTSTMFLLLVVFIASSINSFFYLLITSSEIKLTASHLILGQGILPGVYTALFSLAVVVFNQRQKII
jgi:rod shape-determining protein MreD